MPSRSYCSLFITIILLLLASHEDAHARVFDFNDTWLSAYIRGTGGLSNLGDSAFGSTSGSSTFFDDRVNYNFSGEVGFAIQVGKAMVIRAGAEGLQGRKNTYKGHNSSSSKDFLEVESKVSAFNPVATIEYGFLNTGKSKFFVFGGAGYSTVKVSNSYTMMADGKTEYNPGVEDTYNEAWGATELSYHMGTGIEVFMLDNITFSFEAGYRFLKADKLTYSADYNVIRDTGVEAVTKNSTVLTNDGTNANIDLSGVFVGLTIKIYIPPMN